VKDFFSILARRTKREPKRTVEIELLRKLDQAFARDFVNRTSSDSVGFFFSLFRWAPLGSVAALLLVFSVHLNHDAKSKGIEREILLGEVDFEFYEDLEDWMLTASDEEWNEILVESDLHEKES